MREKGRAVLMTEVRCCFTVCSVKERDLKVSNRKNSRI